MSERHATELSGSPSAPKQEVDELALAGGPGTAADLDEAMTRLQRVLHQAQAAPAGISFDISTPAPERELFAALASLRGDSLSFATDSGAGAAESESKAARLLEELLYRAGAATRQQTRAGGRLVAVTYVGVAGDFTSAVDETAPLAELAGHAKALRQTLQDRQAWMRLLVSTVQAATRIAVATATGNPLLAVLTAWRFLRSVMAEREHMTEETKRFGRAATSPVRPVS